MRIDLLILSVMYILVFAYMGNVFFAEKPLDNEWGLVFVLAVFLLGLLFEDAKRKFAFLRKAFMALWKGRATEDGRF